MAKMVVVYCEDDGAADSLVADLKRMADDKDVVEQFGHPGEAIAMYKVPTQFCTCPIEVRRKASQGRHGNDLVTVRGKRFGFRVYKCCGKPLPSTPQYPRNLLLDTTWDGTLLVSFSTESFDPKWTLKTTTEKDRKRAES